MNSSPSVEKNESPAYTQNSAANSAVPPSIMNASSAARAAVHSTPQLGTAYISTAAACISRPMRVSSTVEASTWNTSFRGRTIMRSNCPLPIRRGNTSNPRAKHSASENAISTTE